MGGNLERLLQHDPNRPKRASDGPLHEADKRWSAAPPKKGTTQRNYADVEHGDLFKEHGMLGDSQRGDLFWNGRIRIYIILYYDGLEVANPLGFARGKYQLELFLYSIVNLDSSVRTSPPSFIYIQLACIAFESDVKRYGPAKVFAGIDSETNEPDPARWATPGAQLRALDVGMLMHVNAADGTRPKDPTTVHAYALLLIADMLAAHKLRPWS